MKKILLVDDMPDMLHVLKRYFETFGHKCVTFEKGQDALNELTANPTYDVVISDLQMPTMCGYEFTEKAKMITDAPILLHTGELNPQPKPWIDEIVSKGQLGHFHKYLCDREKQGL